MRLVKVTWVDSFGVSSDWQPLSDVSDVEHTCISVGYLWLDGKHIKVIVSHYSPANADINAKEQGCGDMAIPCGSIIEMIDLVESPKEFADTKNIKNVTETVKKLINIVFSKCACGADVYIKFTFCPHCGVKI